MIISFVGTENGEQQFFREELPGHSLEFVAELRDVHRDADIVSVFIYSRVDAAFIEQHPKLKLVSTRSTGFEHIDIKECARLRIPVSFVSSYGDNTVAEHTFALILSLARRIREASDIGPRFSYSKVRGFDLKGKTLGIIGSGRIGLHTIRIAKAFEMRVLAYDPQPQQFMAELLAFEYRPLDELLRESDIVSLHAPLLPETFHIIDRESLGKCKDGVLIINTARGALVETSALLEALDSGKVGGAGLDVIEDESVIRQEAINIIGEQIVQRLQAGAAGHELRNASPTRVQELTSLMRNSELIQRRNVVFTPHVAFNSREAVECINKTTVESIRAFVAGKPINLVRLPIPKCGK
jgi:D-lactate dehydrogenase